MDLLTQGLIGSGIALSIARPDETRKAALIGLLAGISADMDFFIQSSNDPLLQLEYHRHFTHSIYFIPVAALLISAIVWPFFRNHLRWSRIFLFSLGGYSLSGFIDACTSYGTRLLWPLSEARFSFNIISIIDPAFTLILLFGIGIGFKMQKSVMPRLALVIAAGYLVLGAWQKSEIQQLTEDYARQQGHQVERLLVKPTLANNWLWRSVYQHQGHYFVNAFHLNPVTGDRAVFRGSKIAVFSPDPESLQWPADSILQRDIQRFAHFSDQYLAIHPDDPNVIIDVRYSNLPNSVLPLWGIRVDRQQPQQHAHYELYRDKSRETRLRFIAMLLNRDSEKLSELINK